MGNNINWDHTTTELEPFMSKEQQTVVCVYIPRALVQEGKFETKTQAEQFMVERMKYLKLIESSKAELTMTGASIAMDYFEHYLDCTQCAGDSERMDVCEYWRSKRVCV